MKSIKNKKVTLALSSKYKSNLANSKRSQEEMVGFVAIIVLVGVIVMIFIAISLRKGEVKQGKEIEGFLHSALLETSCITDYDNYDLRDVIGRCKSNEDCNEKDSCDVLNKTITRLVNSSFPIAGGSKYKGYKFRIFNSAGNETLFYSSKGNETEKREGAEADVYIDRERWTARLEMSY